MGRKRKDLDDGIGSSDDDFGGSDEDNLGTYGVSKDDLDEESRLFTGKSSVKAHWTNRAFLSKDPSKNRKRFTKEDALYGVFGEDSDEDRRSSARSRKNRKTGISFVKGGPGATFKANSDGSSVGQDDSDVEMGDAGNGDDDDDDDEEEAEGERDDMMDSDESDEERVRVPRNREEEEEEEVNERVGGLGLGSARPTFQQQQAPVQPKPSTAPSLPSTFGSTKGKKQTENAIASNGSSSSAPLPRPATAAKPPPPKTTGPVDKDFAKFEKYSKGIGLKYLQKMGYVPGQGLGKDGRGISQPIDVKLRPQKMGLGHKGFDERTETVKRDQQKQKSRYKLSDDEEDETRKKKGDEEGGEEREQVWKRGSKKPKKPKYKTADDVVREQTVMMAGQTIDGIAITTSIMKDKIIDMTGKEAREITDMSQASYDAALRDSNAHLVELRHNIRMLSSESEMNLVQLTRRLTLEKAKMAKADEDKLIAEKKANALTEKLERLARVKVVLQEIRKAKKTLDEFLVSQGDIGEDDLDGAFSTHFEKLYQEFLQEYVEYRLDEVVVGAVLPFVRRLYGTWDPLEDPTRGVTIFTKWRALMKTTTRRMITKEVEEDRFGAQAVRLRPMTCFEGLIYNVWLPRVRSAINNKWSPKQPDAFVRLLELWYPLNITPEVVLMEGVFEHSSPKSPQILPPWLYANVIQQLLLPKLRDTLDAWNARVDHEPVHVWLFPWLPILGDLFHQLFEPVHQKITVMFSEWFPDDQGPLEVLVPWLEIFPESTRNSILNKSVLPKLVAILRLEFEVNPANQNNEALECVLPWKKFFTASTFSHLLETEFFPKWIKVLHAWLSSDDVSYEEVSQWYLAWKGYFPADVLEMPGVKMQFGVGLELMNKSISLREGESLGPVPKIIPYASLESMKKLVDGKKTKNASVKSLPEFQMKKASTLSLRDLLEKAAGDRGLVLLPSAKVHGLGKPLLRLGGSTDGRDLGGVLLYIDDAVIFVQEGQQGLGEPWTPVSLDEVFEKAEARRFRG
ncbi:hypothetical protein HDU97_008919 [Phlyctochytrium planicorne]|nr:hypothetical protein HDU97_008919 [Phlyctochytrium planicorne]